MSNPTELPDLDRGYFKRKLATIVRDLSSYTAQEMAREMVRLAKVADEIEVVKEARRAQAEGEAPKADVETLLYDHQRAVEGVFEYGETGGFYEDLEASREAIRSALIIPAATLSPLCGAQHAAAPGYKVLPVVPTDEMCIAAREKIGVGSNQADHIYRAMVAAAPACSSAPGTPEAPKRLTEEGVRELALQHLHDDTESAGRNGFFMFSAEGLDGFAIDLMDLAAQLDGGQEGSESNG